MDEQLSLTEKEVVLLGLIAERPIHAYGLEEKIKERHLTEWTDISFSSIYRVLKSLEDKGLISTRLEHEGQGATRRVHEILPEGSRALSENLVNLLSNMKPLRNPFLVALANITRIEPRKGIEGLQKRLDSIKRLQTKIDELERIHENRAKGSAAVDPNEGLVMPVQKKNLLGVKLICGFARRHLDAEKEFVHWALKILDGENDPGVAGTEVVK